MAAESDVEVFWQPDNISADMTPPAAFARYCQPFYDERAHAVAQPYVVHMDGRLKPIQAAVAASALDVVESFSLPQVGNDLTLAEAWAAWPDKVILPNFPAPLCRESSAGITSFVEALLTQVGAARPFMLQFSEDIPTAEWSRVVPLVSELFQRRTTPG